MSNLTEDRSEIFREITPRSLIMLLPRLCLTSLALGNRLVQPNVVHARRVSGGPRASLLTETGKAFHALGYNIGNQLGNLNGSSEEEVDDLLTGIKAALMGEPPEVPLAEYMPKASAIMRARDKAKEEAAAAEGAEALKKAAAEPGATQTKSGLVIKTLTEGSGKSPTREDTVEVNYEGTLVDGTVFDSSYKRGESISFPLSGVIAGWTEGLQLMKVGGKALLTIPPDIAYGDRGSPPVIPPKATLVFTVELLAIK